MITSQAAGLALSLAKGVIRLAGRLDRVAAEKEAVEQVMALPAPALALQPLKKDMRDALAALLAETAGREPDPLGADRDAIRDEIEKGTGSDKDLLFSFVARHLPALATSRSYDLNSSFLEALRAARPDWAADPAIVVTAFHVRAGEDFRKTSYSWRIALTVVDAVAEFGGENAALFVRDDRLAGVVGAVLSRFGEADLQRLDSTREILRAALGATLNGALDARPDLGGGEFLEAVLDGLARARESVPAADRDDFLLGLVRGEGYPALVGSLLEVGGERLHGDGLRDVAGDFLVAVGGIVKKQPELRSFFDDHWGDLVRAGFGAVGENATALLGEKKLLGLVLTRVAKDLAKTPDAALLGTDALTGIVTSVAAAAAENPDAIEDLLSGQKQWMPKLVLSVAGTVADEGIRRVFTRDGVEGLLTDAFATFAEHPELLVGNQELPGALVGGILRELAAVPAFRTRDLADAAVAGALAGIAENPAVLRFEYAPLVASLAGKVGKLVAAKSLTGVQGREIVASLVESLAENPALLLDAETKLAEVALDAVVGAAKDRPAGLVAGMTVVAMVEEVALALAERGRAALATHPAADLAETLQSVVAAGLTRAETELGRRLGLATLPAVIGDLVAAFATGKVATIDPEDENFKKLFSELAEKASEEGRG